MELHSGLALNPQRAQTIEPEIANILSAVAVLPFGKVEAERLPKIENWQKSG